MVVKAQAPYKLNLKADIPITATALTGAILTFPMRYDKQPLDSAEISALSKEKLAAIDRNAAGMYDEKCVRPSDALFYSSFAFPLVLMADSAIRKDAWTIAFLYLETVSIGGLLDGLSAGLIDKPRPYVYNSSVDYKTKSDPNATGSFYGSHPSFTALSSFFVAKVYSDYHPDSRLRPWIWAGAGAITLASSITRYRTGRHFISDIAVGVGLGTGLGILIPELHKRKTPRLTIAPYPKGATILYRI